MKCFFFDKSPGEAGNGCGSEAEVLLHAPGAVTPWKAVCQVHLRSIVASFRTVDLNYMADGPQKEKMTRVLPLLRKPMTAPLGTDPEELERMVLVHEVVNG